MNSINEQFLLLVTIYYINSFLLIFICIYNILNYFFHLLGKTKVFFLKKTIYNLNISSFFDSFIFRNKSILNRFITLTNWTIFFFIYLIIVLVLINTLSFNCIQNNLIYFFFLINFNILSTNLIGLIPYSYTITAQFIYTFTISYFSFLFFNLLSYIMFKEKILKIIVPNKLNFNFLLILIPLEFISYLFRPISLGIRLFANIMSGHILLKIIIMFIVKILNILSLLPFNFILNCLYLNSFILVFSSLFICLFVLETFVSIIQSYVFLTLMCLFLHDLNISKNQH